MLMHSTDFKTLQKMLVGKIKGEKIKDDHTMLMERVIQLVSNLPSNSKLRVELTNTFLGELWYSLEHPPAVYVGDKFQYRQADGSYNVGHLSRGMTVIQELMLGRTLCFRSWERRGLRMRGPSLPTCCDKGRFRTPA